MSIMETMSRPEKYPPDEAGAPTMGALDAELVRTLNEKVAIITGFADRLLQSAELDETDRLAAEAIHRQAQSLRELFRRP